MQTTTQKKTAGYINMKINESSPVPRGVDQKIDRSSEQLKALKNAKLIMSLVQQKLFKWFPMWRSFYTKMPPIASFGAGSVGADGVGTMCTTGSAIFYDPQFVVNIYDQAKKDFADEFPKDSKGDVRIPNAGLAINTGQRHPMDYALFVIIHEILHCSLSHHIRMPKHVSKYLTPKQLAYYWNIAADYEINHHLMKDVKSDLYRMVPSGVRADEGGFAVPEKDREFFMSSTAENIYWRIVLNMEELAEERGDTPLDAEPEPNGEDEGEEGEDEGEGGEGGDPGEEGEDEGEGGEGGEGGDPGEDEGEGGEGGEGGDPGGDPGGNGKPGEGDNNEGPLKSGSIIFDREAGTYGKVTSVQGDSIEYDPMSEEQARASMKK